MAHWEMERRDGRSASKPLIYHYVSFKVTIKWLHVGSDCMKETESHFCKLKNVRYIYIYIYINVIRIKKSSAKKIILPS
jgi:hypothetical protein